MTADTSQQIAAEIPTDPDDLYLYLRDRTSDASEIADRLAVQLGGTPFAVARACDLVDDALGRIQHDNDIDQQRANLAENIEAAINAVTAADRSLAALMGDLYDVEYAEGIRSREVEAFLNDARRMLRAAAALNPCPPADQR